MSSAQDYPLESPPPGKSSNFNDPESRGPAVAAVCYLFLSVMWPIFLSRLYSKIFILRDFGWDDGKPNHPLSLCLLTYNHSFCHPSRSIFHLSQVDYSNESDIQKIGATAYASITIWLIAVKGLGPHEWDVRATVWTENMWRVNIML